MKSINLKQTKRTVSFLMVTVLLIFTTVNAFTVPTSDDILNSYYDLTGPGGTPQYSNTDYTASDTNSDGFNDKVVITGKGTANHGIRYKMGDIAITGDTDKVFHFSCNYKGLTMNKDQFFCIRTGGSEGNGDQWITFRTGPSTVTGKNDYDIVADWGKLAEYRIDLLVNMKDGETKWYVNRHPVSNPLTKFTDKSGTAQKIQYICTIAKDADDSFQWTDISTVIYKPNITLADVEDTFVYKSPVNGISYSVNNTETEIELQDNVTDYTVQLPDNTFTVGLDTELAEGASVEYFAQNVLNDDGNLVQNIGKASSTLSGTQAYTLAFPAINNQIPIKDEKTKAIIEATDSYGEKIRYNITFTSQQPRLTSYTLKSETGFYDPAFIGGSAVNSDNATLYSLDRYKFFASHISESLEGASQFVFRFNNKNAGYWYNFCTKDKEYFSFTADTAGTIYFLTRYPALTYEDNGNWRKVNNGEGPTYPLDENDEVYPGWRVAKTWNDYSSPEYFLNLTEWKADSAAVVDSIKQYGYENLEPVGGDTGSDYGAYGMTNEKYVYAYKFSQGEEVTIYTPGFDIEADATSLTTDVGVLPGLLIQWDLDGHEYMTMNLDNSTVTTSTITALANVYGDENTGNLIYALYDENTMKLMDVTVLPFEGTEFTTQEYNEKYSATFDVSGYEAGTKLRLKAFIFNNMSDIKPISISRTKELTVPSE